MPGWELEQELREIGFRLIAGVDEVGRGALAGPIVAAAVMLPFGTTIEGIDDSKRLAPPLRLRLSEQIMGQALSVSYGQVSAEEIDRLGVLRATFLAMERALAQLDPPPECVLVDGPHPPPLPIPAFPIVKGDQLSTLIAAASICAKVERDRLMEELDRQYPDYGFGHHKGYCTEEHLQSLSRLGPCPVHRRRFNPVSQLGIFPPGQD